MLIIVGNVGIGKGRLRHGEGIARVRREEDGEEGRRTPWVHTVQPGFCNKTSARHQRRHPGCWLIIWDLHQERLYRLHFFIFVFHSKGKLNGNVQMPPFLAPLPSRYVHDDTFSIV